MCQNLLVRPDALIYSLDELTSGGDMTNSERELAKKIQNHLCRKAPRILSALLQRSLQAASLRGPIRPDILDRICEQSLRECIARAFQLLAPEGDAASRQPYADAFVNQQHDDLGPLNSYDLVQPWLATAPPPNEFYGRTIQPGQTITSSGNPYYEQLGGSIEQNSYHQHMDLPGSTMADYYPTPVPELTNGGIVWDQLESDLGPLDSDFTPLDFDFNPLDFDVLQLCECWPEHFLLGQYQFGAPSWS